MKAYRGLVLLPMSALLLVAAAIAQIVEKPTQGDVPVPSLLNPRLRLEPPDTRSLGVVRFLTSDDYPPFNFALPDGTLTGYNVDLARAICEELKTACTIQPRRFDTLLDALDRSNGDAVIAALAVDGVTRARVDFSLPYFPTPARFVGRRDGPSIEPTPESLATLTVGVVAQSAHAAFLSAFFPKTAVKRFDTLPALEDAVARGSAKDGVDLAFGDAASLAFWLNGGRATDCCRFLGTGWLDRAYFGEGHAIAVRKGDSNLRRAVDWALTRLSGRGALTELYLRYFPVPLI